MLVQAIAPKLNFPPSQSRSARSVTVSSQNTRQIISELTSAGNLLCDQGSPDEALECFLKAMSFLNSCRTVGDKRVAICHYNTARAYAMLDKNEEALEHYRKALDESPRLVQAHNNIGMLLNQSGRFDEAGEHFKKAIKIDGLFAPAYYGLGVALQSMGDNVNAAFAYQKALTFNPESYPAWINLGLVCHSIENYEVAINCYKEAIGISDTDAEAFYNLGLAYMGAGDLKQAASAFSDALKIRPDHESAQDAVRETMYFLLEKQS